MQGANSKRGITATADGSGLSCFPTVQCLACSTTNAASKALASPFLTPSPYWNHKHGDQMHSWVSGRASNPLEIERRPTNLSEEILASSLHTDMLQSWQSTGLEVSHCTLSLYWFNTKKGVFLWRGYKKCITTSENQKKNNILNTELVTQQQKSRLPQNRSCFQKAVAKPNTTSNLSTSFP